MHIVPCLLPVGAPEMGTPLEAAPSLRKGRQPPFGVGQVVCHFCLLDAITKKYRNHDKDVQIIGLNGASMLMPERPRKLGARH